MAIKRLPSQGWPGDQQPDLGAPLPSSLIAGGANDSAGFPWEGRTFDHHGTEFADDDGTTPIAVAQAIASLREAVTALSQATTATTQRALLETLAERHSEVVMVCSTVRFLIPLIAQTGSYGLTPEGKTVEKSQELSIVTVAAPDGRKVLPIFTSVEAMQRWNPVARPIPVPGPQVALAASQEETDLVIIDAGDQEQEFGIRRPALESFALGKKAVPAWADAEVVRAFEESIAQEPIVRHVVLAPGDPTSRLLAPEVTVALGLEPGLDREQLNELNTRLQHVWSTDQLIAQRVDSLSVQFTGA